MDFPFTTITTQGDGYELPDGEAEMKSALHMQEQQLLASAVPLTSVSEISAELRLIRFFIERHLRDAAYIAADNAKQSLASLSHNAGNDAEVNRLSKELELLESDLRKTMPFTL